MLVLGLILLVQQPAQPQAQQLPPSPIARVAITPAIRSLTAGDTMRLTATPLGADGKPIEGATIRYFASGGRFEGRVDSTGLVYAGSTGTLGISAVASVPGTRPVVERIEIGMGPGPTARLSLTPAATRLVVGQAMLIEAKAYSAAGDVRADPVRWRSSASRVASVSQDGLVKAIGAGRATVSARVDGVEKTVAVEVLPNTIAAMEVTPAAS